MSLIEIEEECVILTETNEVDPLSAEAAGPQVKKIKIPQVGTRKSQRSKNSNDTEKVKIEKVLIKEEELEEDLPFSCTICNKKFRKEPAVQLHIRRSHNPVPKKRRRKKKQYIYSEINYKCKECFYASYSKSIFNVHMKKHRKYDMIMETHKGMYVRCEICTAPVRKEKGAMESHMKSSHSQSSVYCEICSTKLKNRYIYIKHLRVMHPDVAEALTGKIVKRKPPKTNEKIKHKNVKEEEEEEDEEDFSEYFPYESGDFHEAGITIKSEVYDEDEYQEVTEESNESVKESSKINKKIKRQKIKKEANEEDFPYESRYIHEAEISIKSEAYDEDEYQEVTENSNENVKESNLNVKHEPELEINDSYSFTINYIE